jgi:hypothetical protein
MMALRPLPVRQIFPLARVPMLGRARLGQGFQQPQLSPADNLAQNGAILQVNVSVPSSYTQGGGAGTPKTLTAMVDSGASISCITIQQAQAIGLPQVSSTQLGGVGGMTNAPVYGVALDLTQFGVKIDPVQIAGVANPLPGVDMLIGRDVLRSGSGGLLFSYHGGTGSFVISQDTPVAGGTPAPGATPPAPGQPIPTQPIGMPPTQPTAQAPAAPPPPPQNLPQPPASEGGTVLGMKPAVAAGVGAGILAAGAGALHLFKVI